MMKRIICFDTSIATSNMGDYIIADSCNNQLEFILKENFVLYFPTHTPVSHWYQDFKKCSGGRYRDYADYKFVFGTNLLNANMLQPTPTWNINIFNYRMAKGAICVGVGMGSSDLKANSYTKKLYKKILNSEYYHSTRDEKTAVFLRELGFKAINTGCVTTWNLNNEFCSHIPHDKSDNVVFTLTDYKKDSEKDLLLIKILKQNYKKLYFWIQGIGDLDYLSSITSLDQIELIPPSLRAYDEILSSDVDYVGTRLHAGIRAMQMKKRAIILEVDNRATDMKKSIALNSISRFEIDKKLDNLINSSFPTSLGINMNAIDEWKGQFYEK